MLSFILVLVLFALAFWLGRRSVTKLDHSHVSVQISKNYFKGLNYLLNEENDKALNSFIKGMSVDGDTIETHLALGGLFRRRGELTRAIRVHQNLLARPTLNERERLQAELALAYDYLAAGMLDRAEHHFLEVANHSELQEEAWYRLLDIYQREKRWRKALEVAEKLERTDPEIRLALAHHYCELAELMIKQNNSDEAQALLKKARKYQRRLARIDLLSGDLYFNLHNFSKAIEAYQHVVECDPDYLSEAIPKLLNCYQATQDLNTFETYLLQCQEKHPRTATVITLTQLKQQRSLDEALHYLQIQLKDHPSLRGALFLIELRKQQEMNANEKMELQTFYDLAKGILQKRSVYRCQHCGFSGRILFWQCPSCKRWSSMKPIHGIEGD